MQVPNQAVTMYLCYSPVSLGVMLLRRWVRNPRRLETTRCGEFGPLPMEKLRNLENRAADSGPLPAALVLASLDATFAPFGSGWFGPFFFVAWDDRPNHPKANSTRKRADFSRCDYVKGQRALIDRQDAHTDAKTHTHWHSTRNATASLDRSFAWISLAELVHKKWYFFYLFFFFFYSWLYNVAPGSSFSRRRTATTALQQQRAFSRPGRSKGNFCLATAGQKASSSSRYSAWKAGAPHLAPSMAQDICACACASAGHSIANWLANPAPHPHCPLPVFPGPLLSPSWAHLNKNLFEVCGENQFPFGRSLSPVGLQMLVALFVCLFVCRATIFCAYFLRPFCHCVLLPFCHFCVAHIWGLM